LYCSSICDGFIRVDGFVEFLSVEEVLEDILNFRDTSGSSYQDNFVNVGFGEFRVRKNLLYRRDARSEEIVVEFFEFGTSDLSVEVNTIMERINFDGCLGG
jgi:hypothetical protein